MDDVENGGTGPEALELAASLDLDRKYQYPRINARRRPDLSQLSDSDVEVLDSVAATFGCGMSFTQLRALTHETPAYEKAWTSRQTNRGVMRFEDFFEEDSDARSGVREEMLENDALRKAFPDPAWF